MTRATPNAPALSLRQRRLALLLILGLAAALRLAHWAAVAGHPFFRDLVMDSQEYDRWAQGIAGGDWLGGEAFFQAPLYPYFLGVLYRLGGHQIGLVYLLQIAFAVAGVYALYRAGRELRGEAVGLAAAALMATTGVLIFYDVQLLKESLATAAVAALLWRLVVARRAASFLPWAGAGLLWGVLILLRENALLLLPFLLPLAWRRGRPRASLAAVGALLAGAAALLVPVAARNAWVSGDPLPTTYQGGVNFYIGNNPDADGGYRPLVPGKQVPAFERQEPIRLAEQATGRELSPAEVSRYWLRRSLTWAAQKPLAFLRLQLEKLRLFWRFYEMPDAVDFYYVRSLSPALRLAAVSFGGLAILAAVGLLLVRGELGRWAPVLLFAVGWTASTVAFFIFSRYRAPIIPALALLAAVPVAATVQLVVDGVRSPGRRRAALLAVAGVLLALALPHFAGQGPRWDLVHYNLGRVYDERGETAEAEAEYRAAVAANPRDFLSWMNLGSLAARRGDYATAVALFEQARTLEPEADQLLANLGGAYLATGRLDQAATTLEEALRLNPTLLQARHNLALVYERQGRLEDARKLNAQTLQELPHYPPARRLAERLAAAAGGKHDPP
jgi:tetratricopeptide (TPR) repeat protein